MLLKACLWQTARVWDFKGQQDEENNKQPTGKVGEVLK